jgi:hypothetical protein
MTIFDPSPRPGDDGRDAANPDPRAGTRTLLSRPGTIPLPPRLGTITTPPRPGTLTAGRLKVTLVLNAAELNAIKAPERHLAHPIAGSHTAEIAAKSPRKAQTAIRDARTQHRAYEGQRRKRSCP